MNSHSDRIRVLVVDDSALARRAIIDALSLDPAIEVIGTAPDPYVARDRILELRPDVVTLDMEMPRMDGLTFLRILQEHHPVPVVVLSTLTTAGSELAYQALAAGAVDVLAKPDAGRGIARIAWELANGVKAAARSRLRSKTAAPATQAGTLPIDASLAPGRMLFIGASTGGVEALRELMPQMPADIPPTVIVQHIPAGFSRIMANHLDELCRFKVREAVDGDLLQPGLCLVAPGDFHATVVASPRGHALRLLQTPPVHHCRPSVDVLFRSAAETLGAAAVAALLTGMGSDGARGMQMLRKAGARTLAESEESCVVFGMPAAAIQLGAAEQVVPLSQMPRAILRALSEPVLTPAPTR
jgi:two-component system chemotaxis response regulator CheB